MTNPFGPNPFERNPFDSGSPGPPFAPQPPPAPPAPPRDEANVLATLSVVFAFVFAPAGAILGHLGLSQIRRTGERGRDRALVGVTLSYVFITAAVIALVVGATLLDTNPTRVAAPTTTTTTTRTTTTAMTTTTPPPPTVAPADVDGLLPNLEDVKNITGDPAMKVLEPAVHTPTADPKRGHIDRPDCWAVLEAGAPEAYDPAALAGFVRSDFSDNHDVHHQWVTAESAAAFHDSAAAQAQLTRLLSMLRQCGGSTTNVTWPNGRTYPVSMKPPVDVGNGITTMEVVAQTPVHIFCVRAAAAKANVVVDVNICSTDSADRSQQAAVAVTNLILGRIPG